MTFPYYTEGPRNRVNAFRGLALSAVGDQTAGPWSVSAGPWSVSAGPWSVSAGPWSVSAGPWSVSAGPWSVSAGPWPLTSVGGPLTSVGGPLTSVGGPLPRYDIYELCLLHNILRSLYVSDVRSHHVQNGTAVCPPPYMCPPRNCEAVPEIEEARLLGGGGGGSVGYEYRLSSRAI